MIMQAQHHFALHRNPAGRLVFTDEEGTEYVGVEPVRSFPISEPNRWISLVDRHGHELASISDLAEVSPEIAQLIAQQLADREFLPRIERIVSVEWHKEPHELKVITDRGPFEFLFRDEKTN